MTAIEMINDNHNQGDKKSFLYLFENTRNPINPTCSSRAVYLLLNANPMAIPAKIQNHFFSWKIALYRPIKLIVQNKIKGTSGVELKERMEMKSVETIKTMLRQTLFDDRKSEASL